MTLLAPANRPPEVFPHASSLAEGVQAIRNIPDFVVRSWENANTVATAATLDMAEMLEANGKTADMHKLDKVLFDITLEASNRAQDAFDNDGQPLTSEEANNCFHEATTQVTDAALNHVDELVAAAGLKMDHETILRLFGNITISNILALVGLVPHHTYLNDYLVYCLA